MISAELYTPVFYHSLLLVVLLTCVIVNQEKNTILWSNRSLYLPFVFIIIFYIGLRPANGPFPDMYNYTVVFRFLRDDGALPLVGEQNWIFATYMYISGLVMQEEVWFLITAALYVGLVAWAFHLIHKRFAYLAFLMFVASFSFLSYGTNGIRNGLATSVIVLGIASYKKKWLMGGLFFLGFGIHYSTLLPITAFVLTIFYKNSRHYLMGYGLSIILSLVMGGWIVSLFNNLNIFADDRFYKYLNTEVDPNTFRYVGFRIDFLLYSVFPVIMGSYYIFRKEFRDPFYIQLFNTYITVNAFWILIIRSNFSNRFAYLSWFLMSWVIVYPLLKKRLFKNQKLVLMQNLGGYFAFTYLMFWLVD